MDKANFKHQLQIAVRNYEIDWQGIVHNAVYLHYFEVGRVQYLTDIGAVVDINSINSSSKVVLVRNEIDYKMPARFRDVLNVYSRISAIRNTSFDFEGILENNATKEIVGENKAVHVWLDPKTNKPTPVPQNFRNLVRKYEGERCRIEPYTIIV